MAQQDNAALARSLGAVPIDEKTKSANEELARSLGAVPISVRPPVDNTAILAQQRAKYPSAQELGDPRGRAQTSFLESVITTEPGAETMMGPEAAFLGGAAPSNLVTRGASGLEMLYGGGQVAPAGAGQILKSAPAAVLAQSIRNAPVLGF